MTALSLIWTNGLNLHLVNADLFRGSLTQERFEAQQRRAHEGAGTRACHTRDGCSMRIDRAPRITRATGIEWTETASNATTGCHRVSPGCDNCYALTLAKRLKAMGSEQYQQDGDPSTSGSGFKLTLHPEVLDLPRSWRQSRVKLPNECDGAQLTAWIS